MVVREAFGGDVLLDHVMYVGSELDRLQAAFADIGLEATYGGIHGSGITHNALIAFEDGTYLELLSTVDGAVTHPTRGAYIDGNAGPCGWIVEPADLSGVLDRAAAAGLAVASPEAMSREREDGELVEWELASIGEGVRGTMFPTLIVDRTPRERRVPPAAGGSELTGVAAVVLGVEDLPGAVADFRAVFGLPAPSRFHDERLGLTLAAFAGTPVLLATPREGRGGWLADRIARFGDLPCAFLLRTTDLEATATRRPLAGRSTWMGRGVGWFNVGPALGGRVGVIEPPPDG